MERGLKYQIRSGVDDDKNFVYGTAFFSTYSFGGRSLAGR
jgi:hypothetical protein